MKYLFFFLIVLFCVNISFGQTELNIKVNGNKNKIQEKHKQKLDKKFKKYETFSFDKSELKTKRIEGKGKKIRLNLEISKEYSWDINLELNDMRSPDVIYTKQTDMGEQFINAITPQTYKGRLKDGSYARFSIEDNKMSGLILNGKNSIFIRKGSEIDTSMPEDLYVVYEKGDSANNYILSENVNSSQIKEVTTKSASIVEEYFLEIAIDIDYTYYQLRCNSDFNTSINDVLAIMNEVEAVYESTFNMKFVIPAINVWTTVNDPYSKLGLSALVTEVLNESLYWKKSNKDILYLFTGNAISNPAYTWNNGISLSNVTINRATCALTRPGNGTEPDPSLTEVTAHEIGHCLGASDNPSGVECNCGGTPEEKSVMCQGPKCGDNNLFFCPASVNEIKSLINRNLNALKMPFPSDLFLTGISDIYKCYRATNSIISTQEIQSGNIIYNSKSVELRAGFSLNVGATLEITTPFSYE